MPNRLANETSPYLLQHANNPVDWYPWGPEALETSRGREQADPAQHRLRGVPLVPRDGARVVRGRGDRRADERAVRQHQGRSRGAAGPRRHLHAGRAGDDGPRRLADDRVPHAGGRAVLRRHVLPAGRPPRDAVVHAHPHGRLGRVREQAGRRRAHRGERARDVRRARPSRRGAPARSTRELLDRAYRSARRAARRATRRLRGRAEVSADDVARLPAALLGAHRASRTRWRW